MNGHKSCSLRLRHGARERDCSLGAERVLAPQASAPILVFASRTRKIFTQKVGCGVLATLAFAVLVSGCRTAPAPDATNTGVPPELLQSAYLFEIARYLYRWQLDEPEIERLEEKSRCVVWVRRLEPKLDPGDHSLEAELLLPQLQITVKVKKEDYNIEELGVTNKSPNFRITRITRDQVPARMPGGCALVQMDMAELSSYLFRTRDQHDYPDPSLVEHLRQAFRKEAIVQGILATNTLIGDQIVYLAPVSPVANDTWVFWEAGRKLLYVASDIDLTNPAVWDNEALMIHIWDLDEQVVGSHEEAPASNRFLTREEVGRALFNCVVLGQRIVVQL